LTPRRWSTNTRAWAYRYLVLRDGEACALCHAVPTSHNPTTQNEPTTQNQLDIDHIDGNPKNNHPDNLRLLCRKCNVALSNTDRTKPQNPSDLSVCERYRKEGRPATRIAREDANYREGSPEMQANLLYEVPFRRWIMKQVTTQGSYDYTTAINEGAEVVGCSPQTTSRYLAKLTSPSGPLAEIKDALGHRVLVLKDHLTSHKTHTTPPNPKAHTTPPNPKATPPR